MPALKSLQTYTGSRNWWRPRTAGRQHAALRMAHGGGLVGATYASTVVFFRYDPTTGACAGTVKLRHTITLAKDGQSFPRMSVPEFRDPEGNLLPGSNARRDSVSGERINVEPIPS